MTDPLLLYPDGTPNAAGDTDADRPRLFPFPLEGAPKPAVLVLPGGGYQHLAGDYEGADLARFFNAHGMAGFVLHYRLAPRYRHPAPLQDAVRALRLIRSRAADFNVDPAHVAVLGFSAGGHLAGSLSTLHHLIPQDDLGPVNARPDAAVLCYPVISCRDFVHKGSFANLLGDPPDPLLVAMLSLENAVTPQTPPTFLWHTVADQIVPVENTHLYAAALRKHGVPHETHIYPYGHHGLGMAVGKPPSSWPGLAVTFLKQFGF